METQNTLMRSVIISLLLFVSILISAETVESTDVSGIISTNTTWTLADSPYVIVGDTLIEEGNKLIIEPGVEIIFDNSYALYVDGSLEAVGNSMSPINITTGSIEQGEISFRITSDTGENAFKNCFIDNIGITIDRASVDFLNSKLLEAHLDFNNGNYVAEIRNNSFSNCTSEVLINSGGGGSYNLVNNSFYSCAIKFYGTGTNSKTYVLNNSFSGSPHYGLELLSGGRDATFRGNRIFDNENGVNIDGLGTDSDFTNNLIYNNGIGLRTEGIGSSTFVEYNTIVQNNIGVDISYRVYDDMIRFNNIYNNTQYDAKTRRSYEDNTNIPLNYWGTTNLTLISEHIYDYYDDYNLGKIVYEPILTAPVNITSTTTTTTTTPTTTSSSTTTTIPSEDDPPDVDIDYSSKIVFTDEEIVINVSALDDNGLLYIWVGDNRGLYGHYDCNGKTFCSNTWNVQITDEGLYTLVGVAMDTNNQLKRTCSSNILVMDRDSIPPDSSTTTTLASGGVDGRSSGGGSKGGSSGFSAIAVTEANCFDGIQNCHHESCEEGVDCGGPCEQCPSCEDRIQNQGEKGIDCGGPCKPCEAAATTTATATTIMPSTTTVTTSTLSEQTTTVEESMAMSMAPTGLIGQAIKFSEKNPEFLKGIVAGIIISMFLIAYVGYLVYKRI